MKADFFRGEGKENCKEGPEGREEGHYSIWRKKKREREEAYRAAARIKKGQKKKERRLAVEKGRKGD